MSDEQLYESDLLDAFAMSAMQELLRDDLAQPPEHQMGIEWVAKYSYVIAQSMMEARSAHNAAKTA